MGPTMQLTRRQMLKTSAAATALAATGASAASSDAKSSRPNVLFIMTDQQRGDCLSIDGHPCVETPNMDRIGREGAYFKHAYSTTPTCTPARAALLTGMQPWNHGQLGYYRVAPEYPVEMPQLFRDAGYYTTGIGKMHWHHQRTLHGFHKTILDESGRVQTDTFISDYRAWFASVAPNLDPDATGIGWNDYNAGEYALPEELHPTVWTADVASRFIDTYDREDPFFLKVSFARPHSPYDAPSRWFRHYEKKNIPERHIGDWADRFEERSDDTNALWHGDLGPDEARHSRVGYYGSISFIDEQIGRILDTLEKRGLTEETLIVFTSDHGDMMGDHHLWRKSYPYEASARIPMLMRWPEGMVDAVRGQTIDAPVEIRDILPTLYAATGREVEGIDGDNMLKLVTGEGDTWREYIDLEHDICYGPNNHWSALTDGKTKYIYHALDGEEQLFDLVKDPGEETDLAPESAHAATLKKWRARLVAHLEPRGEQWVKNGNLVPRPKSIKLSPNYPKSKQA